MSKRARFVMASVLLLASAPAAVADHHTAYGDDAAAAKPEGGEGSDAYVAEPAPAAPPPAAAKDWRDLAPGLRFGGSLRTRYEARDDFAFDGHNEDFVLTQIRLNLGWTPFEGGLLFVEGQDAEIIGEQNINEDAVTNTFSDAFDVHQVYAEMAGKGSFPYRVRVGRQKIGLGAERLVSPLEWVNTARVQDAVRVTLGSKETAIELDLFASRIVPVDPNDWNDWYPTGNRYADSDFHGAYATFWTVVPDGAFSVYMLQRHENVFEDRVFTIGGRLWGKACPVIDYDLEGAYQGGDFGDVRHQASMSHEEVGISPPFLDGVRLAFGHSYGSGDEDATDDVHETFDNLYPLNHKYYGLIDFMALQNMHSVETNLRWTLFDALTLTGAYHAFWLEHEQADAWYEDGLTAKRPAAGVVPVDPYVGSEMDFTIGVTLWDRVWLLAGYSHFFTGSYVRRTGPDHDADFGYVETKVTF